MSLPNTVLLPLIIALLLGAYTAGNWLYERAGRSPFLHPVLVSTAILSVSLSILGISREAFSANVSLIDMMLGPAVVALAVPLYDNLQAVGKVAMAVVLAVLISGVLIMATTIGIHLALGVDQANALSVSLRSVTAPVAVAIAASIQLVPEVTMLSVFVTGLTAVVAAPFVMKAGRLEDDAAVGLVLGITGHTFGIAKALERSPRAAAFATVGMGFTAMIAAVLFPLAF